jgi:C-terminal processing protease CtpA/Prc
VTATPSKKSSIKPGDRVLEINGVPYTDFKSEKAANELFEKMVLDIIPAEEDDDDDESEEESDDDLD